MKSNALGQRHGPGTTDLRSPTREVGSPHLRKGVVVKGEKSLGVGLGVFRGFRGHSLRARRVSRWTPTFAMAGLSSCTGTAFPANTG